MRIVVDGLPYPIIVAGDASLELAALMPAPATRVAVVCDRNVSERAQEIASALERAGARVLCFDAIEAGERRKRWKSVAALHNRWVDAGADRGAVVIAVGGGTLTDVAGFAAATYLRGVRWIAVATTVLGMVDAAIGGKTGVDLPQGKNLVGSIWQPIGVVADLAALATLPPAHKRTGMAEIIKAGIVARPELLDAAQDINQESAPQAWGPLVAQAASVKASIVAKDPDDRGARAALNLGHTIGHAIEQASCYRVGHGAAVAVGLRGAGVIARDCTGWNQDQHRRVLAALRRCGLKVRLPNVSTDSIMAAMARDKKRVNGSLRFVLPVKLGEVRCGVEVAQSVVRDALQVCAQTPRRGGF